VAAGAGNPPVVVNAAAGTATNLDADQLDGQDSSAFLPAEIYENSASQTISPGSSSGTTATCDPGDVAVSGSYAISQAEATLEVNSERRVDDRFDQETGQTNPSGWHVIAKKSGHQRERDHNRLRQLRRPRSRSYPVDSPSGVASGHAGIVESGH
jgi:hypothetical protein